MVVSTTEVAICDTVVSRSVFQPTLQRNTVVHQELSVLILKRTPGYGEGVG